MPESSQSPKKTIVIEVDGGLVSEVYGLPEGFEYEIVDRDTEGLDLEETKELADKIKRLNKEHPEYHLAEIDE